MPVSSKHLNELLTNQERVKDSALFAIWPGDRRYYSVKLDKFDQSTKTAKVHFEDGKRHECPISELHLQFVEANPYEAVDDVVCCVCDSDKAGKQNEIVICDTCQQGYHQKCHNPKIPSSLLQPEHADDDWTCGTCDYMVDCHLKREIKHEPYASTPRVPKKTLKSARTIKLPRPPKDKAVKPEPRDQPESQVAVKTKEGPKSQAVVPMEEVSVDQQAQDLAKSNHCEPTPNHIVALSVAFLNKNAEAITTPDFVEAIAAKDAVDLVEEVVPKSIEPPTSSQASKVGPFKPVTKVPAKKATKTKKTETNTKNPRKNLPIAA